MKEVRVRSSEILRLELTPDGYGAINVDTAKRHDLVRLAARLRWRHSVVLPHEPRMPPHEYIVVAKLVGRDLRHCRIIEFIVDNHPETYAAYFRGYQYPMRYLDLGTDPSDYRYWRTRLNKTWFVNRCRIDSVERPRRVDRGAKPIPPEEWGAQYPWWPRDSGYGCWKKDRNGVWRFRREPSPKKARRLFDLI